MSAEEIAPVGLVGCATVFEMLTARAAVLVVAPSLSVARADRLYVPFANLVVSNAAQLYGEDVSLVIVVVVPALLVSRKSTFATPLSSEAVAAHEAFVPERV